MIRRTKARLLERPGSDGPMRADWHDRQLTHENAVLGRKPVLVFQYSGEKGWTLRNVGAGPALNVLIAQKHETGPWFDPVRAPAISKDGEFSLSWLGQTNMRSLGVSYSDFEGVRYTSVSEADVSRVQEGSLLGSWSEREIQPFWTRGRESD